MNAARPAGFWIRAGALVIDVALFGLVQSSLKFVATRVWGVDVDDSSVFKLTIVIFTVAFAGLYVTLLHATAGQTIGKLLVGARVVLGDGERVPVGVALLRFFAYFVSSATLGFGYLMAGLRHDKRALHDLIAGTRVERSSSRAPAPALVESSDAVTPPTA
jgi:uncharacterized RDD family membrane protein YckC